LGVNVSVPVYVLSHLGGTDRTKCQIVTIFAEIFDHVYLLKSGRYYKIGRSNAVERRERELAWSTRSKRTIPLGNESYWHRRFEGRRKNGEWFELTTQDVVAFRRRKFM